MVGWTECEKNGASHRKLFFPSLAARRRKGKEDAAAARKVSLARRRGERIIKSPLFPFLRPQVKVFRETHCSGEEEDEKLYRVPALINGLEIEVRRGVGRKKRKELFLSGGRFVRFSFYGRRWREKVLL